MDDRRQLAVHGSDRSTDGGAERVADGLMAEADAQDGTAAGEMADDGDRHTRLGRAARAV